jgi:hypothetical protein
MVSNRSPSDVLHVIAIAHELQGELLFARDAALHQRALIFVDTLQAPGTGKKLERDTIALRDQALAMAALLDPASQLELSNESESGDGSIRTSFEDATKASLFFQQLHLKNQHQKMVGGEA